MEGRIKKFKPFSRYSFSTMILWVGVFAAIGVTTLLVTRAATPGGTDTSCVFQMADQPLQQAFCEGFNAPQNGGTQTGDLDPVLWGVSRSGAWNPTQALTNAIAVSHNACSGGGTTGNPFTGDPNNKVRGTATPVPLDARICNGMYVESNNDGGTITDMDSYPKQPFNFTNRTGTVVFDVTGDASGTHGAWPEFVITDEPVPGTLRCISVCPITTHARNSIGFSLAGGQFQQGMTGVDTIFYTKDDVYANIPVEQFNDIKMGCLAGHSWEYFSSSDQRVCAATKLNHIEIKVSVSRIDIYGTDSGSSTLKHLAGADIPGGLGFSQGLIWINDVHYNAHKAIEPCQCGTQEDHSFGWDNVGFDGPKTYRDVGYDVPLGTASGNISNNGDQTVQIGYSGGQSHTFTLPNVTWTQTPTKAKVVLNAWGWDGGQIKVSLNSSAPVSKSLIAFQLNAFSFDFPTSALKASGQDNTITVSTDNGSGSPDGNSAFANTSLILVAGAPVPGGGTTAPPPVADTSAPTVSISSPTANATLIGASNTIQASASDNTAVTKVEFYVDGTLKATDTTSPYSAALDSTQYTNGSHSLTAKAYDAANNIGTSAAVTVTVNNAVPDTTMPTVSITAPATNAVLSGSATLTANAVDNIGLSKVEFYMDGTLLGTDTAAPYSFVLNTTLYNNTGHSLTAKAYDTSNNTNASSAVPVTINNIVADTIPPSIIITAPLMNAAISGSAYMVAVTAADANGVTKVEISVDGTLKVTDTTAPYIYSLDTSALSNAAHTISAKAYDAAGNSNLATVNITVSNSTPPLVVACDFNADGHVDLKDLLILLQHYGKSLVAKTNGDCNGDGTVDLKDLIALLGQYGK